MKLLFMGDSNSGGIANVLAGTGFAPGILRGDVTFTNATQGGESSAEALTRLPSVLPSGPFGCAVLCYGTVDLMTAILAGADVNAAALGAVSNLLAMAGSLMANGTPKVFLAEPVGCGLTSVDTVNWPPARLLTLRQGSYTIGHCLRGFGHTLSYAQPQALWLADGIHMEPLAYEQLALRALGFLRAQGVAV